MPKCERACIAAVFGTRPEAVKMAPLLSELSLRPDLFELHVIVTAQHREMLDQVLDIFSIVPEYDLGIMRERQSLTSILTRALSGSSQCSRNLPDLVLFTATRRRHLPPAWPRSMRRSSLGMSKRVSGATTSSTRFRRR